MKKQLYSSILPRSLAFKIGAIILGYVTWLVLAHDQIICITQKIPLILLASDQFTIKRSPTHITATLEGSRKQLQHINLKGLTAHLDLSEIIKTGTYQIQIPVSQLHVPNELKLISYAPVIAEIELVYSKDV